MSKFLQMIIGILFIGLRNSLRTIRYARQKDQWEQRVAHLKPALTDQYNGPGTLVDSAPLSSGYLFVFEDAQLEVVFLSEDILRISWSPGVPPVPYAIAGKTWEAIPVSAMREKDDWILISSALQLKISPEGALTFLNLQGSILREDLPPERAGDSWKLTTRRQSPDAIFGLGERSSKLNLDGGRYQMWNQDPQGSYQPGDDPLYLSIPILHHMHDGGSYLVFFENSFDGYVDVGDPIDTMFEAGMLRYYFFQGFPDQTLPRYTELTGRSDLPPLWSLGFHQSRWSYMNDQEVRDVSNGFKRHDLPISAIHLDIDYMDGFRVFSIDTKRFPDLGKLAVEMEQENIKLVTILDPAIKMDRGFHVYREGLQEDVFCKVPRDQLLRGLVWPGWACFPDFTSPRVREWWGAKYPLLLKHHIAGFWHDMNEPAAFAAWGDPSLPKNTLHYLEGQGGDHRQAHNLYGLLMNRAGYEALRGLEPLKRPFIVSRSGWAGMQRYAWSWTGDTESSWEMLRVSIASMLGVGLSGIPYTGPDIGGFSGSPDAELFLRWFQLAAFTPFFRVHSSKTTQRREPWTFDDQTLHAVRTSLKLRYALLPYIYSLTWEANQTGYPLMRPLFWCDPDDTSLWDIDDAYLFGDSILVAPVLKAGSTSRDVRFPAGTWFGFKDDHLYQGGLTVSVETEINAIPLFIKAGTVLPLTRNGYLELHLYAPLTKMTSTLYSDAGDGYGDSRLDQYHFERHEDKFILEWEGAGDYPFPYDEVKLIPHGFEFKRCTIDGQKVEPEPRVLETLVFRRLEIQDLNT